MCIWLMVTRNEISNIKVLLIDRNRYLYFLAASCFVAQLGIFVLIRALAYEAHVSWSWKKDVQYKHSSTKWNIFQNLNEILLSSLDIILQWLGGQTNKLTRWVKVPISGWVWHFSKWVRYCILVPLSNKGRSQ